MTVEKGHKATTLFNEFYFTLKSFLSIKFKQKTEWRFSIASGFQNENVLKVCNEVYVSMWEVVGGNVLLKHQLLHGWKK